MRCTVITAERSKHIGEGLTYETDQDLKPGTQVRVPLRNKIVEGIVLSIQAAKDKEDFDVKQIREIIGDRPLLTDAHVRLLHWIAEEYCCTLRSALGVFLPSPPWSALLPESHVGFTLREDKPVKGAKQQAIIEHLRGKEWMSDHVLRREAGATSAQLKRLEELGMIERVIKNPEESEDNAGIEIHSAPSLTPAQEEAYELMHADSRPSLLFGITGSGKTEVYAAMIADALRSGKQAILLVPEILLTEHIIHRFHALLDVDRIAVIHSRLTPSQRRETWKRIHRGEIALVIGSRSALFAPLPNIGLIILDEEHEWTYKNEQTPRYHARETAEAFTRFAGAKLVLGSATPSLESWARAKTGTYHLARLPERYGNASLPEVRIVDLATVQFEKHYPFSPPLLDAIGERLKRGEQSILFLNRRGVATALLCLECRRRIVSPDSQLPLTVHRSPGGRVYLADHTSGLTAPVPTACPSCGSQRLLTIGAGTQRLEDILAVKFPNARILRADSDTLQHPEQMRLLLKKMRERQADILLGTQSVVKGLDLPEVTLAAVLLADVGLSLPHFRAGERVFQLLSQLTGRSGRAKPGNVIIQTFRPQAPEVLYASKHATEQYLDEELKLRTYAGYPPMTKIVRLIFRGPEAATRAKDLHQKIQSVMSTHKFDLHSSVAPTLFGGGKEWHILIRGADPKCVLPFIALANVVVDIDPIECV